MVHIEVQIQRLRTHGLRLYDTSGLGIQQLRAKCARFHAQYLLNLVMGDSIQLRCGDTKGNYEQKVGSTRRGLKELASA